tara:strand:+ start:1247 stop:1426 length:180 start_codon:yes stop_codon:yes gene_type:complete
MPKKKKPKNIKPIFDDGGEIRPDIVSQFNVRKTIEDSRKIKPKDVFDGYKDTKKKKKTK